MPFKHAALALVTAAAALTATPASAEELRLLYAPGDLTSHDARAELLERIARQARASCRTAPVLPPRYRAARARCEAELTAATVAQIDDARLTAQHQALDEDELAPRRTASR